MNTLPMRVALARVRAARGEVAAGRALLEQVHAWAERTMGAEHPSTRDVVRALDELPEG